MKAPDLLHIFSSTKNVSPFDINMAYEAQFDAVIPYADVTLEDTAGLTQDAIFSRGPQGVKHTGIFIGGREFNLAMEMFEAAKAAMVPPFEVSVFVDPSGAITTAAAIIACVERWVKLRDAGTMEGKRVYVIGVGPVGICSAILAAECGAEVYLASYLGLDDGQAVADEYGSRFGVKLHGADSSSEAANLAIMARAEVVIGAAKAGICVVPAHYLQAAPALIVAADVNAVPPAGIEGVALGDMGKPLALSPGSAVGIGALAIGDIKFKVHTTLFQHMLDAEDPIYLSFDEAFAVARKFAGKIS